MTLDLIQNQDSSCDQTQASGSSHYSYTHGGNAAFEAGREGIVDLSANINPLGMPEGVHGAIIRAIDECLRYPDSFSSELRDRIAAFEGVSSESVFCGNGASDIIFRLPRAIKAKSVLLSAPTFSDYERAASSFGAQVIHHTLTAANGFTLDQSFIEAVRRSRPSLIFVCNPNNPTGRLVQRNLIEELLQCCEKTGSWLAVDECFLDFSDQAEAYTSKVFLAKHPRLLIIKAFTKLFAMPGVRLGYLLASDSSLIEELYFHGGDWAVSNLAQAAGIAALKDAPAFIRETVEYVRAERNNIEDELVALGFQVFPAAANYVFFRCPQAGLAGQAGAASQHTRQFDLFTQLDVQDIRIRSCGNYPGLDDSYFRVAVSKQDDNRRFISAVQKIMNSRKEDDK
jgi:threonine-phosphate decarboxylase